MNGQLYQKGKPKDELGLKQAFIAEKQAFKQRGRASKQSTGRLAVVTLI